MKKNYRLLILSLFEQDLLQIIDYIAIELNNPTAATNLIDDVEKAIYDRLPIAQSFEKYHSSKERRFPYYRIFVKNFTIFYVVYDDVMEVRRILYNKRNSAEEI